MAKDNDSSKTRQSLWQEFKMRVSDEDDMWQSALKTLHGDFIISLVGRNIGIIFAVLAFAIINEVVTYKCQQDKIDMTQMTLNLNETRNNAMASASQLTEMSRKSKVVGILRQGKDSMLCKEYRPPFIIMVDE